MKYDALETVTGSLQTERLSPAVMTSTNSDTVSTRVQIPSSAWLPLSILGVLLITLYYRVGAKLVIDWANIPDYSHGFLVPLFSVFLLWDKRKQIAETPIQQSWSGLFLVALGLILLIFGVYGVDLFTSRFSFVVLLSGLVWTFLGRAMLRQLLFPILILLLAIPFPTIIFNQITFRLQLLASKLASMTLELLRVPVLQEGNVIQLPVMKLEVAEACSGIRSLMSLLTMAIFYGYFLERIATRRVILALASIPIAVAANAIRIVGTGLCVQYWDPVKALGFFHEFSGLVIFAISLSCLYLIHRLMRLIAPLSVLQKPS